MKIRKATSEDTECSCGKPAAVVVDGGENCYYCGNEINLCEECLTELKISIEALQILSTLNNKK